MTRIAHKCVKSHIKFAWLSVWMIVILQHVCIIQRPHKELDNQAAWPLVVVATTPMKLIQLIILISATHELIVCFHNSRAWHRYSH